MLSWLCSAYIWEKTIGYSAKYEWNIFRPKRQRLQAYILLSALSTKYMKLNASGVAQGLVGVKTGVRLTRGTGLTEGWRKSAEKLHSWTKWRSLANKIHSGWNALGGISNGYIRREVGNWREREKLKSSELNLAPLLVNPYHDEKMVREMLEHGEM